MPEWSRCLFCGQVLEKLGGERLWRIVGTPLRLCAYGRYHHPNLDVPTPYSLASPDALLERWLDA